jgi:hypothetical protein
MGLCGDGTTWGPRQRGSGGWASANDGTVYIGWVSGNDGMRDVGAVTAVHSGGYEIFEYSTTLFSAHLLRRAGGERDRELLPPGACSPA